MKLLALLALAVHLVCSAATTTPDAWLGPDQHRPLAGPPGAGRWPAAVAAAAPGLPAPDPAAAPVGEVRRFFAALTEPQRAALAHQAPGVVGNLDGAPHTLRYTANQQALTPDRAATPVGFRSIGDRDPDAAAAPAGHVLGYDPRGDGRLILVLGDLDAARHVAVLVPGSGWSLDTVLRHDGPPGAHPVTNAAHLYGELRRLRPEARAAVVMWLGYDAPEDVDRQAARSERAAAGARALTRFVQGLPAGTHVTLLCHSYGAVVCGRAAATAPATDVVALAAPGMDASTVAGLHTGARVWAARTAGDLVWLIPDGRVGGWGHGTDPTAPAFGARRVATGDARGHDAYYTPASESLANLARITLGRTSEVTTL